MSDQLPERRDTTVLKMLQDIQKEQLQQSKDLAINTTKTDSILDQVRTLNGKVIAHETRLQSIESDKAVQSKLEAQREEKEKVSGDMRRRWSDRVMVWLLMGAGILIWRLFVALGNTGHLKDIIK